MSTLYDFHRDHKGKILYLADVIKGLQDEWRTQK